MSAFRDEFPMVSRLCVALLAGETLRAEARGPNGPVMASVSARAVAVGVEVHAYRDAFDASLAFVRLVGFSGAESALGAQAA